MIVLPMAGLSSRFFREGYREPKYKLELDGLPVFDYALRSFAGRFGAENFLIVLRREYDTEAFVAARLAANDVKASLVVLEAETRGQAETVALGLEAARVAQTESLTIFNIDSFRPGFSMTPHEYAADGYLETFDGAGDSWSFVKPASTGDMAGHALRVVEKERISDLCCTGLYYFKSRALFQEAYAREQADPSQPLQEHYIAPIYNQMISDGKTVLYRTIPADDVIFCGVPAEYRALVADPSPLKRLKQVAGN